MDDQGRSDDGFSQPIWNCWLFLLSTHAIDADDMARAGRDLLHGSREARQSTWPANSGERSLRGPSRR